MERRLKLSIAQVLCTSGSIVGVYRQLEAGRFFGIADKQAVAVEAERIPGLAA
jgi:hypothetical protein